MFTGYEAESVVC